MNLKEEIMYMTTGKFDATPVNKVRESFIKSLKEDVKEYGFYEATDMYSTIYGLTELKEINEEMLNEKEIFGITTDERYVAPKAPDFNAWTRSEVKSEGGVSSNIFQRIWEKVKKFSTGQFSSLKKIIEQERWADIVKLPIFKGALAAGGVAAVIALISKIFKKKLSKKQEAEIAKATGK